MGKEILIRIEKIDLKTIYGEQETKPDVRFYNTDKQWNISSVFLNKNFLNLFKITILHANILQEQK